MGNSIIGQEVDVVRAVSTFESQVSGSPHISANLSSWETVSKPAWRPFTPPLLRIQVMIVRYPQIRCPMNGICPGG